MNVLGQMGYHRAHAEPAAGFDARFRKGTDLDSQRWIESRAPQDDRRRPLRDDRRAPRTLHHLFADELAGTEDLRALGPEERLLHACFEARVGDTKPFSSGSATSCSSFCPTTRISERIEQLSGAWGAQSLVAEAVGVPGRCSA